VHAATASASDGLDWSLGHHGRWGELTRSVHDDGDTSPAPRIIPPSLSFSPDDDDDDDDALLSLIIFFFFFVGSAPAAKESSFPSEASRPRTWRWNTTNASHSSPSRLHVWPTEAGVMPGNRKVAYCAFARLRVRVRAARARLRVRACVRAWGTGWCVCARGFESE
jgi:hypothetical protein